jgi:CheY-like chemotaxis protein
MRKKILVAEKSDAIRSIAESILHQHGYDVVSASNTEKAKELIITAKPNMVIIGADLKDSDERYLYDALEENENTSSIPLLLIADPEGRSLSYPEEVILPRPFDPDDFIERVRLFVGGGVEAPADDKVKSVEPFTAGSVDDEVLDEALGLDRIEVEDSEEMNKTATHLRTQAAKKSQKKDIFEVHQPEHDEASKSNDSDRVESLMIRDEAPETEDKEVPKKEETSASSKIELTSDQYGIINPDKPSELEAVQDETNHDYDWFIKEMQKETAETASPTGAQQVDSQKLKAVPTSDVIEPLKVPPSGEKPPEKSHVEPEGVDKFISQFKQEAEKISAESASGRTADKAAPVAIEEQKIEEGAKPKTEVDPAEVRHFVNYLVELLSEKLAKKIVEKIDKDEIYRLIKEDITKLLSDKK